MPSSRHDVVIVGAGQSGLALSRCLSRTGVDHVILERHEVASAWRRQRWDSLRLLTPNWMSSLGGAAPLPGGPDGFARASDVADHLGRFARAIDAPVVSHSPVDRIEPAHHGWRVRTAGRSIVARAVVLATGPGATPRLPAMASTLSSSVRTMTALEYRNPDQLDDREVLVVGASASGAQIADELAGSGRAVTLAVGEHVRAIRRHRGRDLYWWLDRIGLLDESYRDVDDLQRARSTPSFQLVGSDDDRDIGLNALRARGVRVAGRLVGADRDRIVFSGSLANHCASADLKLERLLDRFDHAAPVGSLDEDVDAPRPARTVVPDPPLAMPTRRLGTVIWATGFTPTLPVVAAQVRDRRGRLVHDGGHMGVDGLYVLGLPFLRRRRSSLIAGAAGDAADIATSILAQLGHRRIA